MWTVHTAAKRFEYCARFVLVRDHSAGLAGHEVPLGLTGLIVGDKVDALLVELGEVDEVAAESPARSCSSSPWCSA